MLKKSSVFKTIMWVAVLCFILSGPLSAACPTCRTEFNGNYEYHYVSDKLVSIHWIDAAGKFHEQFFYSAVQNTDPNPFGEIEVDDSILYIPLNVEAADLEIYQMYGGGNTVWENGGPVHVNDEFAITVTNFSEGLHMIVTLDTNGNITNSAIFKKGNNCSGSFVGQ